MAEKKRRKIEKEWKENTSKLPWHLVSCMPAVWRSSLCFFFAIVHWDLCVRVGRFMWFSIIHFILLAKNRRLVVATVYRIATTAPYFLTSDRSLSSLFSLLYTHFLICASDKQKKKKIWEKYNRCSHIHRINNSSHSVCIDEEEKWSLECMSMAREWIDLGFVCVSLSHSFIILIIVQREPRTPSTCKTWIITMGIAFVSHNRCYYYCLSILYATHNMII